MRFSFEEDDSLSESPKALRELQPCVSRTVDRHPSRGGERFLDTQCILETQHAEDVLQLSSRNVRQPRFDSGCDKQLVESKLQRFAGLHVGRFDSSSPGNDAVHLHKVVNLDSAFALESFGRIADQLSGGYDLCQKIGETTGAVRDVGKPLKNGDVEPRIEAFCTRRGGEACRIATDHNNL